MAENSQNRRYPQNLQGVLQLAVEAGSAAEGPAPLEPMSEEVRLWLNLQSETASGLHAHTSSGPYFLVNLSKCPQDLRAVW